MAVQLKTTMTSDADKLAPAYSDIVIYAENIPVWIINLYNIKYICQVYINGVLIATLKAPLDNYNKAIFRIAPILQDYTETDKSGYDLNGINSTFGGSTMVNVNHSIHQIDKYARNRNNLKNCFCIGGYEYSNTPSGTIIQVLSLADALQPEVSFNFFNSVLQHKDGYSSQDFSDYLLTGSNKKFLSKFRNLYVIGNSIFGQKIQLGQYHTLGFLNGKHYLDSEVTRIRIQTYDSTDTLLSTDYVDNTSIYGGATFDATIDYSNTDEGLLYFGCGTAQLEELGVTMTDVSYYYVQAFNVNTAVSSAYKFDIQEADCKGYETIRLAFLNSLGAWDYYNFTKKSVRKTQINKSPIKQNYGYTPYFSTTEIGDANNFKYYNQGTYDGGTRVFNTNATETIEANTDFITQDEASILEELFLSPDVYMQTGNTFEPVVINETEYIKQTSANDMLKQYIITIEKGHNTRVQRL